MREIVVIAHDIRSTHNIGSLLRTAEGLGINHVYISGLSPYPTEPADTRLPHIHQKLTRQIHKTALGAETSQSWSHINMLDSLIVKLKADGYRIVGLEQAPQSVKLPDYKPPQKLAIVLGREVDGLDKNLIKQCDDIIEIPMFGSKESFNVVQAAAMALYHCKFEA